MKTPTVKLYLDRRHKKKDGTYPFKFIIYYQRKHLLLSPKELIAGTEKEFIKISSFNVKEPELQAVRNRLADELKYIRNIITLLGTDFSFDKFKDYYHSKRRKLANLQEDNILYKMFVEYISEKERIKKYRTAESINCGRKKFKEFAPNLNLLDVTPDFLRSFEAWMLKKGNSISTVGIYTRYMRYVMRKAVRKGILPPEHYPFGNCDGLYTIPASRNVKKALNKEQIAKIIHYRPQNEYEAFAKDIWLFTFYCNGINIKDICKLKYEQFEDDYFTYIRSKTEDTLRNKIPIVVYVSEEVKEIIEKWGNPNPTPSKYVFPVFKANMTEIQRKNALAKFTGDINKQLKIIAVRLNLGICLTTYHARHSYATTMKHLGTSIDEISESLGHSSTTTTKLYLDSFPKNTWRENNRRMMDFIQN